jgi:hypothetical protein
VVRHLTYCSVCLCAQLQLDALKARLGSVLATVAVPNLVLGSGAGAGAGVGAGLQAALGAGDGGGGGGPALPVPSDVAGLLAAIMSGNPAAALAAVTGVGTGGPAGLGPALTAAALQVKVVLGAVWWSVQRAGQMGSNAWYSYWASGFWASDGGRWGGA